jgi:ribonuclease III
MPRRSQRSARRSTTSPATSSGSDLAQLIDGLPPALAECVFRHSSWADDRGASYERLEFLGDSVLELAVAAALYERHPDFPEGRLTKARAHVVSRATCAVVGAALGLGERLVARSPEGFEDDATRLSVTPSVVGAVLEAALGALFLEHGFAAIEGAVIAAFSEHIETAVSSRVDPKSDLQEFLARSGRRVMYTELSTEGPAHDRRFTCAAVVDGKELGRGEGRTKKDAEQAAAREALAKVEATPE